MGEWLNDIYANNVPMDEEIYNYLCPTNRVRLVQLMKRLDRLRSLDASALAAARKIHNKLPDVRIHLHIKVTSIQGKKSGLVGRVLEAVIRLLTTPCKPVSTVSNLRTSTAEIDVLLGMGPLATVVPMLRMAGTHIIGEAKCYITGFKQEWVNELRGLMEQHQCSHSILFLGCPTRTLRIDHRHGLQLHASQGRNIVPFGMKQLHQVANGENFLAVLSKQHVDVQTGAVDLSI